MMIGTFHGHAHNWQCQLDWHPKYISGTGHSEGEGCEHIFSASNELTRSMRHASRFHWHQAIEEHYTFWDMDKYAALSSWYLIMQWCLDHNANVLPESGTFLWNHYQEALNSVQMLTAELEAITCELGLSDGDFPEFFAQERTYLDTLKHPPPWDQLCIRYVEVFDELTEWRSWNFNF